MRWAGLRLWPLRLHPPQPYPSQLPASQHPFVFVPDADGRDCCNCFLPPTNPTITDHPALLHAVANCSRACRPLHHVLGDARAFCFPAQPAIMASLRQAACGLLMLASWTWTAAAAEPAAADFFVHSLPGAPEGSLVKMHAG